MCMNRLSAFVAVTLFLFGCSGKESGDLSAFIVEHATQLGAHAQQTNSLPRLVVHWYYKEDPNGLQVYIVGDHLSELQSFLAAAFGPKPGVDLSYRLDVRNGGKERITSLSVVRLKR